MHARTMEIPTVHGVTTWHYQGGSADVLDSKVQKKVLDEEGTVRH